MLLEQLDYSRSLPEQAECMAEHDYSFLSDFLKPKGHDESPDNRTKNRTYLESRGALLRGILIK